MNTLVEHLCRQGTVSFDFSEKGYSIIFEPHPNNSLPVQMQSTVLIIRKSPCKAATALKQYLTRKKHWSEYPESFWVTPK